MKIALLSDVHDNINNLLAALQGAKEAGCTHLFYMGDIVEHATLNLLLEEWGQPADIVFGNNEYDKAAHLQLTRQYPQARHHRYEAELCIDGRKVYFTHLPYQIAAKAESLNYDAVFYGHTHVAEQYSHQGTLIANPGEVGGVRRPPQFGIYDTQTNSVTFCKL